ncbi:MAG: polysulfide reductase NrfD, partial [Cyanobacteria bacterium]|nr:polysulfide reductase NrfD [Cyanobacteriota bacterium]
SDVSAYMWTKSIASGVMMVGWVFWMIQTHFSDKITLSDPAFEFSLSSVAGINLPMMAPDWIYWLSPIIALVFLGLTGIFLIKDLDRPERFWTILVRPQWKSWLAIGAYIILFYSIILVADLGAYLYGLQTQSLTAFTWLWNLSVPLAVMTAIYTAFLFAQAKGRDLWQSPLLPANLFLQAVTAGTAALMIASVAFDHSSAVSAVCAIILVVSTLVHLAMVLFGEIMIDHPLKAQERAVKLMIRGPFRQLFWVGYVVCGTLLPAVILCNFDPSTVLGAIAAVLALVGLLAYEHCFVMAGQSVRLS